MPFEPQAGETVLFPTPFVANEPQKLVISTKRVVQYAPQGMHPIAEFPINNIEHVGRMSERPTAALGIVAAIIGAVLIIVSIVKVLPELMHAGAPSKSAASESGEATEDGIEGRDSNDDDPFEEGKERKENTRDKATKKLSKLKEVSFGWPGFTEDVVVGIFCLLGGAVALLIGASLYKRERHVVFCRVGTSVYPLEVKNGLEQTSVMSMIQSAQQASPKK